MAQYKQTERLKKSKSVSRKRIRRAQKAYDKIEDSKKAGMGLKSIADFGLSMIGAVQSVQAATAPNQTAWESHDAGLEAVGLPRTDKDLTFWDKLGRGLKGPDLKKSHEYKSDFKDPASGDMMTSSHIYTGAEISHIGKEILSGTAQQTLKKANTENWSDIFGTSGGSKAKVLGEEYGKTSSLLENANANNTLKASVNNQPVKTDTSTTETVPTESMDVAWKSQYKTLDEASISRNKGESRFDSGIDQYSINQALKLGGGDWSKAGQVWGSDKWLEAMKNFNI